MSKLDDWVWRWTPVLLGALVISLIALVAFVEIRDNREFDEFKSLCASSGGVTVAYSRAADLCIDAEGKIIITR